MDRRNYNSGKKLYKFSNTYYSKQLNKIIFVLVTLLIILVIKMINNKTTNNIIKIIERNIYYDFSLKEDGKKVKDYLIKAVDNSKESIEEITLKINKNQ